MKTPTRILYVTSWVLGDAGANAADIFPRLAAEHPSIERVIVADFPRNKHHILTRQHAEYLRLEWDRSWFRLAARIARKAKREDMDVIHVFYRQQNAVLLILIRIWLMILGGRARLVMDHRSVNLARGWRRWPKLALNTLMQLFAHHLAGNPWAVETNHLMVFRPKQIIDLGYDTLPDTREVAVANRDDDSVNVWFIGSLKPRNRKSQFLLDTLDAVAAQPSEKKRIRFHLAGPASDAQVRRLTANPLVTYHGQLKRADLYRKLQQFSGLGLAYMNLEFHAHAPSLKFAEYAIMRYRILASDTPGLRTQGERMKLSRVQYIPETVAAWSRAIREAAEAYEGADPQWGDAANWSYPAIFEAQVLPLYQKLTRTRSHGTELSTHGSPNTGRSVTRI